MGTFNRRQFLQGGLFTSSLWLSSMVNKSQAMGHSDQSLEQQLSFDKTVSSVGQSLPSSSRSTGSSLTAFNVSDVDVAEQPLPMVPSDNAMETLLHQFGYDLDESNARIEASSHGAGETQLVDDIWFHPFIAALHHAYADHRPVSLSPDMIWLLIAHGLATHINVNAEQLRDRFVAHDGKVTLEVWRNQFKKGAHDNDWEGVFTDFSTQIREHIGGENHDRLLPTFSTTSIVEKAAAEIVLMDAMQSYFSYDMYTACGIPQIKLEGTVSDWQAILEKTKALAQYDLQWWTDHLIPILEQFVAAAKGEPDQHFWQSMYKWNEVGSGNPYITGWVIAFFPYLEKKMNRSSRHNETTPNRFLIQDNDQQQQEVLYPTCPSQVSSGYRLGITTGNLPSGLAKAPFKWFYFETVYEMEFLAGFVGIKQDPDDLTLRPEIGWIVRDADV